MLELRRVGLGDVTEITPARIGDNRGFFIESWNRRAMLEEGFDLDFVQDNHSYSAAAGVVRGLHYQIPPFAQDKLVRVTQGSIFDVVVNIRRGSPEFGCWISVVLSASAGNQLLIPRGYAHGFMTLEAHTETQYKVTAPYSAVSARSIRFDDPAIGVKWPRLCDGPTLSAKDEAAPPLAQADLDCDWS